MLCNRALNLPRFPLLLQIVVAVAGQHAVANHHQRLKLARGQFIFQLNIVAAVAHDVHARETHVRVVLKKEA